MSDNWYDNSWILNIFWFLSGAIWLPIYIVWSLVTRDFSQDSKPKWLRWWGNRVDNLIDQLKEWLHCHKIPFTDYQLNISCIMKNRDPYGYLIRPNKDPDGNCWSNCDPEDF